MQCEAKVLAMTSAPSGLIPISVILTTSDTDTYRANCHCGIVTYTCTIPALPAQEITLCDCSICVKNGYLMAYTARQNVVFRSGYDTLKAYQFANKRVSHKFCPECGSSILIDFHGTIFEGDCLAVNVSALTRLGIERGQRLIINVKYQIRMLQGIDPTKLKYKKGGTGNLEPAYKPWGAEDPVSVT